MPPAIKLLSITSSGEQEVTRLESGIASIGREPENVVVVDSAAVSRRHACLMEAGSQWVFRDLGSTNGSRLNGVKINGEQLRLLRGGDVIGIADFQMRVEELADRRGESSRLGKSGTPSLLIFADDRFISEHPMQRSGGRFSVGGPGSQIALGGDMNERQHLEIRSSFDRIELVTGSNTLPVSVNGNVVSGETALVDRDEIVVGYYRILVNFPESDPELESRQARVERTVVEEVKSAPPVVAYDRPNVPEHLKSSEEGGWAPEASRRKIVNKKFVFGTNPEEENVSGTLAMSTGDFASRTGFEMNPSQRFSSATFSEEETTRAVSGKLLIYLSLGIVVLVLAIASALAYILLK